MSLEEKETVEQFKQESWWLIFIKGMFMGAVEIMPGVSAGTLALITGILPRLLSALKNINLTAIQKLKGKGFASAWSYIDGNFLLILTMGLVSGFALLVQAVSFALANYPIYIWSFFFGLIFASSIWLAFQIKQWKRVDVMIMFLSGIVFAYYITVASTFQLSLNPFTVFITGMIIICAMILPGLSGSFILVLVGMYVPILNALKSLNFEVIGAFMGGALIGILGFAHVLSFLFKHFPTQIYALLTGLILGSLNVTWPWKEVIQYRTNSHGDQESMLTQSISPKQFEILNNADPQILGALMCALLGVVLVFLLSRLEGLMSVNGDLDSASIETEAK